MMIKMEVEIGSILLTIVVVGSIIWSFKFVNWVWLKPKKLEKVLREQGLKGNPYRLLIGDMKDLATTTNKEQRRSIRLSDHLPPHTLPYYHQAIAKFGIYVILALFD